MIPHLKYIETLICLHYDFDRIKMELEKYGLDYNHDAVLMMYKAIRESNPRHFEPNPPPPDPDWIEMVGIAEMWSYLSQMTLASTVGVPGAIKLLDDPLMYRLITSLALTKLTDEDIELVVSSRQNFEFTVEDIKIFLKYFFNVDGWSLRDRKNFVDEVEDDQLAKFYRIALKGDKEYLIWKLGVTPDKQQSEILADLMQDSYFNFKEVSRLNPELAQKWATLALKIGDKLDKANRDERGDNPLDEFEFIIKTVNRSGSTKPKHIDDLD